MSFTVKRLYFSNTQKVYILENISNNMAKKQTAWTIHLMKVYKELKAKDSNTKLKDAMKVAKKSYKK